MGENYVYMDDDEMMELHGLLEEMLSKEKFSMNALEGATVSTDPSPDYLLRVLCTPVLDRCFYLTMWGDRSYCTISKTVRIRDLPWMFLRRNAWNG